MRKLYEINHDLEKLLDESATVVLDGENAVDTETGEMFNIIDRINALEIEKTEKIKGAAVYFDDLNQKRLALKDKIERFTKQLKALESDIEGLRIFLLSATENQGFKDDDIELKVKTTQRCVFTDESAIPEKFIKTETKIETKISKTEITKAIKSGEEVPGAKLEPNYTLSVL